MRVFAVVEESLDSPEAANLFFIDIDAAPAEYRDAVMIAHQNLDGNPLPSYEIDVDIAQSLGNMLPQVKLPTIVEGYVHLFY
jgi:hypothetical protein